MRRNDITRADMLSRKNILEYTSADNVPLSFKYGNKLIKGIPADFNPQVRRQPIDCNTVQTVIEGEKDGLYIRAESTEYKDFPVIEWVAFIENRSGKDSEMLEDVRIGGVIKGTNAILKHGNGDTCTEAGYTFTEEKVTEPLHITPYSGTSCQGAFPYMTLTFDEYQVRLAIGWPTKWAADIKTVDGGVSFVCGQDRCHMKLYADEKFRTPRLTLMIYENGEIYRGINIWRHWYMKHILPRDKNGEPVSPMLCLHNWMAEGKPEHTGATETNQVNALYEYINRGMKPDVWWIDAGWFPCNYEWPKTGTWMPDPPRFPNGLGPIGKACDDNDVKFLLWFEPERVQKDTELRDEHENWLLYADNKDDENALLDIGNDEAREWISKKVSDLITDSHISIYRQDFNFDPLPVWVKNEAEDRIGAIENKHGQGYLAYWDYLLDNHPGLIIDSCASGGRRNDLETMRRAITLHYTDVGYGNHPIKQKQHREMFEWIPYFRAHNMAWDKPDGTYGTEGKDPDEFAFQCALAPSLTSMYVYNDTEEHYDIGRRMDELWREAAALELSGDYYPMTECNADPHDFYAMQFDDEKNQKGFVQIIRNTLVEADKFLVKLPAVKSGKTYRFVNRQTGVVREFSSKQLEVGFEMEIEKRKGIVLFYDIL